MAEHIVVFDIAPEPVSVSTGSLLIEAAHLAGIDIFQPCGGQGRCGRCAVQVTSGYVRRRSVVRLSPEDVDKGFALACQTVVEGDINVVVPPQEKIERRLTTDRTVAEIQVPEGYDYRRDQSIQRITLELTPPSVDDQIDDASRVKTVLRNQFGYENVYIPLSMLRRIGPILREGDWRITALLDILDEGVSLAQARIIDIIPGKVPLDDPIWGIAIDIGTTTVTLWLVDLVSGKARVQISEYNEQISRGEDIISRIVYASKNNGAEEMRSLVLNTIHKLLARACKRIRGSEIESLEIIKTTISGNSTMMHLLLGIPASSIRLSPFVTAVNDIPVLTAREVGIDINPEAPVICLPGIASYVGADITAGVYSSGLDDTSKTTLFMDIGTNGEIVLGSHDWLVTCACSAGPAFEGAGVVHGMRATKGAIEEVWISGENFEPTYRVIGDSKPIGICGSGLISLLAEMFMTGVVDKAGNIKTSLNSARVRDGAHGWEYVVAWGEETESGLDIVITAVDIDNLLRAKGAIYAGYRVLSESVGVPLEETEQMLIGGSFGKYINVEKAVEIGLLPDMPWDRFEFLGNTSVKGAYYALLDRKALERIKDIASRMTYIELSADNSFYEAFMSALFLPHTDMSLFPSVAEALIEFGSDNHN
jgi:uncharacterized 2Fe-2S/4Fe-4S cluster protein (DUF4445 family)